MVEQIKCPEGHTKVWKKGSVPTRKGPKARYVCFACGRTFYKKAPNPVAVRKAKVDKTAKS
jgi:transposase-like protein